jgi:RNA polymerase sigma factor (sigma-70 family)
VPDTITIDPEQLSTWLHAVGQGDAGAFRKLYDATSPKLFGYVMRILGKRELAEEALQDGFFAIWHGAAGYQRQLAAPMTWMTTIVRNKALDRLRGQARDAVVDGPDFDPDLMQAMEDPRANPIDALLLSSDARALAYCMSTLEGLHRQVVGLAFFHDLSHSEVAQQLTVPIGTVKTWIRRSLERLKACLAKGERA